MICSYNNNLVIPQYSHEYHTIAILLNSNATYELLFHLLSVLINDHLSPATAAVVAALILKLRDA